MHSDSPAAPEAQVRQALEACTDPWIDRTLGELKAIDAVRVADGVVHVEMHLPVPVGDYAADLRSLLAAHLRSRGLPDRIELQLTSAIRRHAVQKPLKPLQGIANIGVVASA